MNSMSAIMRRELSSYFLSPIVYVILAIFALIYAIFFNGVFISYGVTNLQFSMSNLLVVFLFLMPLMTMRSLSEERKMGTEELLMTAPITTGQMVCGKFFALLILLLVMLGLSLIHFVIAISFGVPDLGPIISSYIGLILAGAVFISIGLFASSLSDNQIVSGLVGFGILLFFWLLEMLGTSVGGKLGDIINNLALLKHYEDFNKGVIDTGNLIFYLSLLGVFLFLTIRRVESRRWR
ncbi:MAG TPA: ABC transporter permease [Bacillota bacterium]|nr:ABC transporter permease [Bacillota bacterium]